MQVPQLVDEADDGTLVSDPAQSEVACGDVHTHRQGSKRAVFKKKNLSASSS